LPQLLYKNLQYGGGLVGIRNIGVQKDFKSLFKKIRFPIFCDLSCDFAFKVSKVYPKNSDDSETDKKNVKKLQKFSAKICLLLGAFFHLFKRI
jgi:hypothetical protein